MRYSQNNEEEVILNYFKGQTGFFCDIGAYDGITFSNVRALAELGWKGVCYEADIDICVRCIDNYKDFPNVICHQAAIGTHNGKVNFYPTNGDAIGTTTTAHFNKWGKDNFGTPYEVDMFNINEVLNKFDELDFINIDVEGTNKELFDHLSDYHLNRIRMICIEHDGYDKQMGERLKALGFKLRLTNGENIIYAR
jgi:FkbM family methyltransferase